VNALGIVLFAAAILISVVLHEAGHMICARWSGGKVTEFFVGFGPRIWSFRRGETEYGIKAIPAGGYVKIIGMTDLEPVEPEDEPRAFYNKPAPKRLLTLAAGSLTHFLIALAIFLILPFAFGETNVTNQVGQVAQCVSTQPGGCPAAIRFGIEQPGPPLVAQSSPAAAAGLRPGDQIIAVGGQKVSDWNGLTGAMSKQHAGDPVSVTYLRDGVQHTATISPVLGNLSVDPSQVVLGNMIGIDAADPVTTNPGPLTGLHDGLHDFGSTFTGSLQGLGSIPGSIPKLFTSTVDHTQRSDTGAVGVVGVANIGGQLFGAHDFAGFLIIVASINVFIGIFNLLPILPVDGGHIAILLYEEARKRWRRLFGREDPGRVDLNKLLPVAYTFLMVLVGLTVLLLAADITNPIRLPS
jgi:membrane-associated protease RseP (regulator of RpoE activity)